MRVPRLEERRQRLAVEADGGAGVQQAADALASTLDQISSAAAGDLPDLVSQAKPQVKAYIDALNAYASQFGGQQVPQS